MRLLELIVALNLLIACTSSKASLSDGILKAVRKSFKFDTLYDFGAENEDKTIPPGSAVPNTRIPQIDIAVIQLDRDGSAKDSANVQVSAKYPKGRSVVGSDIKFAIWDQKKFEAQKEIEEFIIPYPASLFKLMVVFRLGRLFDMSRLSPDMIVQYQQDNRTVRQWADRMITMSDNYSTKALLKFLDTDGKIAEIDDEFNQLGLFTLKLSGINQTDVGWNVSNISMGASDTAKLLLLIYGKTSGELWRTPNNVSITQSYLSNSSRAFIFNLLENQGYNEVLSTSNLFGAPNVSPGIPAIIPERWLNYTSGFVQVEDISYKCGHPFENQKIAEVKYAHKTGLTYNFGSDAGIVESFPDKKFRRYIVVFISSLGYRYLDPVFKNVSVSPNDDPNCPIAYTQQIPAFGKLLDDLVIRLSNPNDSANKKFQLYWWVIGGLLTFSFLVFIVLLIRQIYKRRKIQRDGYSRIL